MLETHFTLALQLCMSMVCANTSDAITGSYNRTKDLFTLCCTLVAMVLYYDVTIKVLDFFIESWCGRDAGGECSHTVCGCVPVSWVCVCGGGGQFMWKSCRDLTYFVWAGSGLFTHKREIRYTLCVYRGIHIAHTPTETQLLKESHWFSCCYAGASITIKHHYCADHFM